MTKINTIVMDGYSIKYCDKKVSVPGWSAMLEEVIIAGVAALHSEEDGNLLDVVGHTHKGTYKEPKLTKDTYFINSADSSK